MNWQEWWDKTKCILAQADDREEVARLAYKAGMERAAEICDEISCDGNHVNEYYRGAEMCANTIRAEAASLHADSRQPEPPAKGAQRLKVNPQEDIRDVFVMVQQVQISVGKAMEYLDAWLDGRLHEAFKKDGRA